MNKQIIKEIEKRLEKGKREYADQLNPDDGRDWIKESVEEMLDCCVYLAAELLRMRDKYKPGDVVYPDRYDNHSFILHEKKDSVGFWYAVPINEDLVKAEPYTLHESEFNKKGS